MDSEKVDNYFLSLNLPKIDEKTYVITHSTFDEGVVITKLIPTEDCALIAIKNFYIEIEVYNKDEVKFTFVSKQGLTSIKSINPTRHQFIMIINLLHSYKERTEEEQELINKELRQLIYKK